MVIRRTDTFFFFMQTLCNFIFLLIIFLLWDVVDITQIFILGMPVISSFIKQKQCVGSFQFTLLIVCVFICVFIINCIVISICSRPYSRRLLGGTIARNLLPWVLKKIFLLEVVKNGICLGSASKYPFFEKMCPEKCTHALTVYIRSFIRKYK